MPPTSPIPTQGSPSRIPAWLLFVATAGIAGTAIFGYLWAELRGSTSQVTSNSNSQSVEGGAMRVYSRDGVTVRYPAHLAPRPGYPNELAVDGVGLSIQRLRITRLSDAVITANGSVSDYVDAFSIEFPGPYDVIRATASTISGEMTITSKIYRYSTGDDEQMQRMIAVSGGGR